jgi:hypothetical protein
VGEGTGLTPDKKSGSGRSRREMPLDSYSAKNTRVAGLLSSK